MGAGERISELEALVAQLQAAVGELTAQNAELMARNEELTARNAELEKLLSESRRAGKRQAAPFSKGAPQPEPKRPGRKSGGDHGRHGHRATPAGPPDRELDAPLPGCCPDCGGSVAHERDAEQWQVDLPPARPVVSRFRVGIGRCRDCGRRVQGRHPDQGSDALGAAGSQVGPVAKAWALWLHYELGLSFIKCARLLGRLGIGVTAGALSQAAQATGTALVPVHQDLVHRAHRSDVVVMDETGVRHEVARIEWLRRLEGQLMVAA